MYYSFAYHPNNTIIYTTTLLCLAVNKCTQAHHLDQNLKDFKGATALSILSRVFHNHL